MDSMLAKLEKYSSNLEELVQHRTKQLVEEKKKTDMLLYRMLPRYVQLSLKTEIQNADFPPGKQLSHIWVRVGQKLSC